MRNETERTYHSSLEKRQNVKDNKAVFEKEQEEAAKKYKLLVQNVFGTSHGVEFGKELVRLLGVFKSESCVNPTKMAEDNAAKAVYLELIRPFLTPEQRSKLER